MITAMTDGRTTISSQNAKMNLSSREILPYSSFSYTDGAKKVSYELYHPNNTVSRVIRNGVSVDDPGLIRSITKKAAKFCIENGLYPRNLIGGLNKEDISLLYKSMRR